STVEDLRSRDANSLLVGRDASSVSAQFGSAQATSAPVQSWLTAMNITKGVDTTAPAGSGATAAVPTSPTTQVEGKLTYSINQYLGYCYMATSSTDCVSAQPGSGSYATDIRAVVAVSWSAAHCTPTSCIYVTSTLISVDADPTFKINQPLPAAPVVVDPPSQTNAVNDQVSLQLNVQNSTGVVPFTWTVPLSGAGALPKGLTMSTTGLITGSPDISTANKSFTVTVTVLDAFLRTASASFTWNILPPLVINPVGPQASTTADNVSLTLTASGGTNTGFRWTATGLPATLSMSSAGAITGTPTTVGNYTVQVTVADSSVTRTTTLSFTWTITYPPLAASNPGAQTSTIGTAITTLPLSASGGSGSGYVWSDSPTSLPAGLTISPSGQLTGTPTATGPTTVTLTVNDPTAGYTKAISFTWTVVAKPSITAPGNQSNTVGANVNVQLTTSCPNSPCSYVLNNGPGVLSVSSGGLISGTVSGSPKTYSTVSVTVTDAAGAQALSSAFTWTVNPAPTLAGLGPDTAVEGADKSVAIAYTCPTAPCTITLTGSVPGIGLATTSKTGNNTGSSVTVSAASGTVYLSGTTLTTAVTGSATSKYYTLGLSIQDNSGVSVPSNARWTAYAAAPLSGLTNRSAARGSSPSQRPSYTCPDTCSIAISGAPPGIGLDTNTTGSVSTSLSVGTGSGTRYVRGTVPNNATLGTYQVIVTITDSAGASYSISATWTV
ncbi:MAG: putative Ig domain-containing protein, partial [Jatrophihabitantaceae bacterium]